MVLVARSQSRASLRRSVFCGVVQLSMCLVVCLSLLSACVVTKEGDIKSGTKQEMALRRVEAAKQYLRNNDLEAARRLLREALQLDDGLPNVHDALGLTFQVSGEDELAEKHFSRAVKLGDGESRYRVNFANFLFKQGRYEDAVKHLQKVADDTLYERREQALVLLGLCQQQMAEPAKALRSFERALTLNPRNKMVLRQLSVSEFERQQFEQSWQYLQSYRRLTPTLDAELLLLGVHLARKLDKSDAEASFALALKNLYPQSREYQSYARERRGQ
mgnify:CR=1 FL=1